MPHPVSIPAIGNGEMRGFDLLLAMPDGAHTGAADSTVPLEDVVADGGAYLRDRAVAVPRRTHTYTFTFADRARLADFRAFFDARAGRYQPFWFPLWYRYFELVPGDTASIGPATMRDVGYGTTWWPLGDTYRFFLWTQPVGYAASKVAAPVVDTPGTERINIDVLDAMGSSASLVAPLTEATGTYLWWLRLGRFDTDVLDIEWLSGELARVEVTIREPLVEMLP